MSEKNAENGWVLPIFREKQLIFSFCWEIIKAYFGGKNVYIPVVFSLFVAIYIAPFFYHYTKCEIYF